MFITPMPPTSSEIAAMTAIATERVFIIELTDEIMLSMLIAWTPVSSRVILGVQGRYFLPFLPVLLLALKNHTVVLTKDKNRSILYLMCCLNGYALVRLFSIVCIRL